MYLMEWLYLELVSVLISLKAEEELRIGRGKRMLMAVM